MSAREPLEQKQPTKEIEKERGYLTSVLEHLEKYREVIEERKEEIDDSVAYGLRHFNSDNAEQFNELTMNQSIQSQLNQKYRNIKRSLLKPYFTRVDFAADDEKGKQELYIGKMSLLRDEDNYPLIIDWRAPVSNLYYEGRIGRAEYMSPDGLITGDISLKRQYIIEKSELLDFFDIDITASDDFLQAALGASKDKRLKDIVSTIQAEQNRVIRADMIRPLIVQGAAGSGKTTIALHRIAYLLYHFESRLSPKNIMILAPNKFFISYISEVLPDLGVENVVQTTWEDFAAAFLDEKLTIKPAIDKLAYLIQNPQHFNVIARVSHIKSSMVFKNIIDNYLESVVENLLPPKNFELEGNVLITHEELSRLICRDYTFLPIAKRLPEIRKYLVNALKKAKPMIMDGINGNCDYAVEAVKVKQPEDTPKRRAELTKIFKERDALLKRVDAKSKTVVSDYMRKAKILKPSEYYGNLLRNEMIFKEASDGLLNERDAQILIKQTSKSLRSGFIEEEDIAPLVHIQFRLYGNDWLDLRHIVIDEAQDVSVFQLFTLKEIMNSNSFTILGDLRQGIFYYKGINDWRDVTDSLFQKKAEYVTMAQSYRTTVEIMDFANTAATKMRLCAADPEHDIPLAKPVIRHGEEVRIEIVPDEITLAKNIEEMVCLYKERGYISIALITKNLEECETLRGLLNINGLTALTGKEDGYGGGVVLLPAYLSKGLEFDCVIVTNADTGHYTDSEMDIKLLYIAMTRALHELTIFTIGEKTAVL